MVVAVLGPLSGASAQILSESFSDATPGPNWTAEASRATGVSMAELAGRLQFTCDAGPGVDDEAAAFYSSKDWILNPFYGNGGDIGTEIKVRVAFKCPSTTAGSAANATKGLRFLVSSRRTTVQPSGLREGLSVFLGVGTFDGVPMRELRIGFLNSAGDETIYRHATAPLGSSAFIDRTTGEPVATIGTQGALFVRRTVAGEWTVSTTSYLPAASLIQPMQLWGLGESGSFYEGHGLTFHLGGQHTNGTGVGSGEMWFDNFVIEMGRLVRPPSNAVATDGGNTNGITISWTPGFNVTGYGVFRIGVPQCEISGPDAPDGPTELISPFLPASATSFTDYNATPGQTYHYIVGATIFDEDYDVSSVQSLGEYLLLACDEGWRGTTAPPAVRAEDGVGTDGVQVHWAAVAGAANYRILRKQGTGAAEPVGTSTETSFLDSSALPGIVYQYAVRVITASGDGAISPFDAGWRNVTAPTLTIGDGSTAGVPLSWTAVAGATTFRVERGTTWSQMATLATVASTSFVDTTAVQGTVYWYRIRAMTVGGASQTTEGGPESGRGWRRLAAPATVTATDATRTDGIKVSWAAVPGATAYVLSRPYDFGGDGVSVTVTSTSYLDRWVAPGSTHTYSVRAIAAANSVLETDYPPVTSDSGTRGNVTATSIQGLEASDGYSYQVSLRWSPVRPLGAATYRVSRAAGSGAAVVLGETDQWQYLDNSAVPGVVYSYRVTAIVGGLTGAQSSPSTGWMGAPQPTGVLATKGSSTSAVTVTWDGVASASKYRVYRKTATSAYVAIGTPTATSWSDTTAVRGTPYIYQVRSVTAAGETVGGELYNQPGWRNVVAPANVQASDGTSLTGVVVTWTASTGATSYRVYRHLGESSVLVGQATSATITDAFAVPGVPYEYDVVAMTPAGASATSGRNTGWRNIAAPQGLSASDGSEYDQVRLRWGPVAGADGYAVYRLVSGTTVELLGETLTESFDDLTAPTGIAKSYTVRALTAAGASAASSANTGWACAIGPEAVSATGGYSKDGQPVDPALTNGISITWDAVPGALTYRVIRHGTYDEDRLIATKTTTSHLDTTALPGKSYYFDIIPVFPAGPAPRVYKGWTSGYRDIALPTNVQASNNRPNDVRITWTPPAAALISPGTIATYVIQRQSGENPEEFSWETIGSKTTSPYVDLTAEPGMTYWYRVAVVVNINPESGPVQSNGSAPDTGVRVAGFQGGGTGSDGSGGDDQSQSLVAGGSLPEFGADSPEGSPDPDEGGGWVRCNPVAQWLLELPAADRAPAADALLTAAGAPDCATLESRLWGMGGLSSLHMGPYLDSELDLLAIESNGVSAACRMLLGDIDGDGSVTFLDFQCFSEAWIDGRLMQADLDRNGNIDVNDLVIASLRVSLAATEQLAD